MLGAGWFERDGGEVFQRVLWDERQQIPLIVESGDKAGRYFVSIEVANKEPRRSESPWANLQGYAQKEYSDCLD